MTNKLNYQSQYAFRQERIEAHNRIIRGAIDAILYTLFVGAVALIALCVIS